MRTCEVCGYHVHVLYMYVDIYVCVVSCCVVLCCWLCVMYNNTKLTYPLTVSGDGVPHELPSVSVSV